MSTQDLALFTGLGLLKPLGQEKNFGPHIWVEPNFDKDYDLKIIYIDYSLKYSFSILEIILVLSCKINDWLIDCLTSQFQILEIFSEK